MSLEQRLLYCARKGYVNEEALLLSFSGCSTWDEIIAYRNKIDTIEKGFDAYLSERKIPLKKQKKVAKALHDYLWQGEKRYSWSVCRLTDVVDNHLAGKEKEGNCLGMTSLYTVLALRKGLEVSVMLNHDHIFSRCAVDSFFGKRRINIENTCKRGFGISLLMKYGRRAGMFKEHGVRGLLSAALVSRAHEKSRDGNMNEAISDCLDAVSLDSTFAKAYSLIGGMRYRMGLPEEARKAVETALKLNSYYVYAYILRAKNHSRNNEHDAAIRESTNAVKADPCNYYNYYARALIEHNANDYSHAVKDCTRALKLMKKENIYDDEYRQAIEERRFNALRCRGYAHHSLGRRGKAVADMRQAFELKPGSRKAFRELLWMRCRMKDIMGAISDCDFAISRFPGDASWYKARARLKKEIGDTAGALADYDAAEQLPFKTF